MKQISTKRVYEPYSESDGIRILVDKLWPRGLKKEKLKFDFWEKDIAPSTSLRQWFHKDKTGNWEKFRSEYSTELAKSDAAAEFTKKIARHPTVTLLYAAKDEKHNHAAILKSFLEKQRY